MGEYTQTYEVNRRMHGRPCGQVIWAIGSNTDRYPGVEFILKSPGTGDRINHRSIMTMLLKDQFNIGDEVETTTKGDYNASILKTCADNIGKLFMSKSPVS